MDIFFRSDVRSKWFGNKEENKEETTMKVPNNP
jgi:hypothetical protein